MPRPRKPDSPFRLHEGFLSHVAAVPAAGETAAATVKERWTVKRVPDKPADLARFIATDTWVKRHGKWQVVWRYSNRVPEILAGSLKISFRQSSGRSCFGPEKYCWPESRQFRHAGE